MKYPARTYLWFRNLAQLSEVVAEFEVLKVVGVGAVVLERPHDLVTHPLYLQHDGMDEIMFGEAFILYTTCCT